MPRWQLIVVDDRNDFAVSVWRYVTRTVGLDFDHEEQPEPLKDDQEAESQKEKRAPNPGKVWLEEQKEFISPDGEVSVLWIKADGACRSKLGDLLAKVPPQRNVYLLVDVKGEKNSDYDAEIIAKDLQDFKKALSGKGQVDWQVVSSYPSSKRIEGEQVRRKSIDTLGRVRRKLYKKHPKGRAERDGKSGLAPKAARHILVTGAGFEMVDNRGGFGMPPTYEILKRMGPPFRIQEGLWKEDAEAHNWDGFRVDLESTRFGSGDDAYEGFPIPVDLGSSLERVLRKAAEKGELDLYWDLILEEFLRRGPGAAAIKTEPGERDQDKSIALHKERRMREAFRKSILEHDWGYMNQSLAAAKLPWHAWLTTNYTKFADRALHLVGERYRWGSESQALPWRIISTASEANISVREDTGSRMAKKAGSKGHNYRYLFKLHGDIAHLHTMAIAGHDKDLFNPLCVPVESLFQIYAAADRFLRNSLWNVKEPNVIWHLVGHGLQDLRLFELIQSVCSRSAPHLRHTFLLVNPKPQGPLEVLARLPEDPQMRINQRKFAVLTWKRGAAEYMARLDCHGLGWLEEILDLTSLPESEAQGLKPEAMEEADKRWQKEMKELLQSRLDEKLL